MPGFQQVPAAVSGAGAGVRIAHGQRVMGAAGECEVHIAPTAHGNPLKHEGGLAAPPSGVSGASAAPGPRWGRQSNAASRARRQSTHNRNSHGSAGTH